MGPPPSAPFGSAREANWSGPGRLRTLSVYIRPPARAVSTLSLALPARRRRAARGGGDRTRRAAERGAANYMGWTKYLSGDIGRNLELISAAMGWARRPASTRHSAGAGPLAKLCGSHVRADAHDEPASRPGRNLPAGSAGPHLQHCRAP